MADPMGFMLKIIGILILAIAAAYVLYYFHVIGPAQTLGSGSVRQTTPPITSTAPNKLNASDLTNSTYVKKNAFSILNEMAQLPQQNVTANGTTIDISASNNTRLNIFGSNDMIHVAVANETILVIYDNGLGKNDTVEVTGGYVYASSIPEAHMQLELRNSTMLSI
jgi:hypothetical protein